MSLYHVQPLYQLQWVKTTDAEELINLYHLARTALSGQPCGQYERMLWASKEFSKMHPYCGATAAYKDLDGLLA